MFDKVILILLGIFAILFGILTVWGEIAAKWMSPLMGFAALVLGAVCLVRALK